MLLDALPTLRRLRPDLDVVVAGAGRRTLPSSCRSLGLISEQDKVALLAGADVFVAPHVDRESFGIVLLEAMASGAPIVASDLTPFVDLLSPTGSGSTSTAGVLFRRGDADALAAAVLKVLQQPDPTRTALAQELTRCYDWAVVGASILEVYRSVLGSAGTSMGETDTTTADGAR